MTDYTQLADAIVACGVGRKFVAMGTEYVMCNPWENCAECGDYLDAQMFVQDSRVAMAIMEKCEHDIEIGKSLRTDEEYIVVIYDFHKTYGKGTNEFLPLAINQACIEALSDE